VKEVKLCEVTGLSRQADAVFPPGFSVGVTDAGPRRGHVVSLRAGY
jgi:hypothetical protein